MDVPEQICITRDDVQMGVDGVLFIKILDAERATYGIPDYRSAISHLAELRFGVKWEKLTRRIWRIGESQCRPRTPSLRVRCMLDDCAEHECH